MNYHNRRSRKHKPDKDQQSLSYGAYSDRLAQIDAMHFDLVRDSLGDLKQNSWVEVKRYLKAVLYFDRRGKGCWASAENIGHHAELNKYRRQKARQNAERLDLLKTERRSQGPGRGRKTDLLQVNWEAVNRIRGVPTSKDQPGPSDDSQRPSDDLSRPSDEIQTYSKEEIQSRDSDRNSPPPTSPVGTRTGSFDDAAWLEVEQRLFKVGVNQAKPICVDARRRGVTPDKVRSFITHWQRRREAWGEHAAGILANHIKREEPNDPPHPWQPYPEGPAKAAAVRLDKDEAKQRVHEKRHNRWSPMLSTLTEVQKQALRDAAKDRYPRLRVRSIREQQLYREGILPMAQAIGEQGIRELLAKQGLPMRAAFADSSRPS